ncbi:MAG: hypothetical protein HRU19_12950 [Pseudobacteriovorax sp.]|nr:hypothetical protein [Pseudobacteriovorax sp.]
MMNILQKAGLGLACLFLQPHDLVAEPIDLSSKISYQSITGGETGVLFIPMKGLLRAFPSGFAFCSPSVDQLTTVAINGANGYRVEVLEDCLSFSNVLLTESVSMQVTTAGGEVYDIALRPVKGLFYGNNEFRALRSDSEVFATLTYSDESIEGSELSYYCHNRLNELKSVETRPLFDSGEFQAVEIKRDGRFCYQIARFPWWESGPWETFFRFDDRPDIRYVETIP